MYIKSLYLIAITFLMVLVSGCFIESVLKRTKVSNAVANLELICFISLFSFMLGMLVKKPVAANIFYSIYNGCLDVFVYLILLILYMLEQRDTNTKEIRRNRRFYEFIAVIDILILCSNFLTNFYFDLRPVVNGDIFLGWSPDYNKHFLIHLCLCYGLSTIVAFRLAKDSVTAPKSYRSKYLIFFVVFVITILTHIAVKVFEEYNYLDYSLIVYALLMIIGFIFVGYFMPRKIMRNILSVASDDISDAVICFDYTGKCIYENKLARRFKLNEAVESDWLEPYFESKELFIQRQERLFIEEQERLFDVEFRCIKDRKGKTSGYYVKLNDRTSEIEALERELYRSTHDELTGLYNRKFFFSEAERILKENPDEPRYLIATDIENFKLVNDLFGTKFGDNILKFQAQMLNKADYKDCIKGRISGDKYAMLIAKKNFAPDKALCNSKKIMDFDGNMNFHYNIYLGVYEIANPYENVVTMWDKANLAIKNNTDKTQILCMYDTSLMNKIMKENNIISEFKYAIENNQFCMFIQPQVDSKTGKCIGGEALCRWYDKDGYRHPSDFIPVLEKVGLIYQLDYYIWESAARTLSEWKKRGLNYYISVNISVKDFYYCDIYSVFTELVEKYDISPEKLHLEITESVIIGDKNFHRDILTKLQNYGFSIEMDDFGSGFSSLNALKEMSMDVLKIDMEFLHITGNEERGKVIIAAIVKMAKSLGMKVISEGVETEKQAKFLESIDVDVFQGYLYSKPMAIEEFEHKYLESAL